MDALPDHLEELVNIVLEEELMFSLSKDMADLGRPQIKSMEEYFSLSKAFPQVLVTHNRASMQRAYTSVPHDIWTERLLDLQEALQSSRNGEWARRGIVTRHPAHDMAPCVTKLLDKAFLAKYEELLLRVTHDFKDFFPYRVACTSPQLMVFEKLTHFELIECVMNRF